MSKKKRSKGRNSRESVWKVVSYVVGIIHKLVWIIIKLDGML
jgi:hypothetical protein